MSKSKTPRGAKIARLKIGKPILLPLAFCTVSAGFPSPADDYIERAVDVGEMLVKNEIATFMMRVRGDSMNDIIHDGDRVIIDRSLDPQSNDVVIACLDGEMTVKRLLLRGERVFLAADNPEYPEIEITSEAELIIWGVVTHCVHSFKESETLWQKHSAS